MSLTPVLCDQLERADAIERCVAFLRSMRAETHRLDADELRRHGLDVHADEIERSAAGYAAAADALARLGPRGLLNRFGTHASWTSSATHAVLPMLATDAGIALQVQTGIESHRRRFGEHEGGFWLPECGYAPWLAPRLEEAGVRASCVELTNVFGPGDDRHLAPIAIEDGPVLWPIDRATTALVWSDHGYPARAAYRGYHRHTTHRHHAWRNDGDPYDREEAWRQARADAREFVGACRRRVQGGGVCVCAFDTELLGHWWFEGPWWLRAVVDEAGAQGLALTSLDDALERHDARRDVELGVSSWGDGGDLRTWSGPQAAELAWAARTAELRLAAWPGACARARRASCSPCSQATGRSCSRAGPRGVIRGNGPADTSPCFSGRSRTARTGATWAGARPGVRLRSLEGAASRVGRSTAGR